MPAINVTDEAHQDAKAKAAELGMGIGEYASMKLLSVPVEEVVEHLPASLEAAAKERGETPGVTLEKALQALQMPPVVPAPKPAVPVWEDGLPACRCDGEAKPGPWHKASCHRRT